MSTLKLTFNVKRASKNFKKVKKFSRKFNSYTSESNKYFIVVEVTKSDIDKDFRLLFNSVINNEDTTIELDNEIVKDTFQFRHVINCRYLNSDTHCFGICRMMDSELDNVFGAIGMLDCKGKRTPLHPGESFDNADYTVINDEDETFVNKHKLCESFLEDTKLHEKICQKYNLELVKKKFSELPDLTPLTFSDESTDKDDKSRKDIEAEGDYDVKETEDEEICFNLNKKSITKIGDEFEKRLRKVLDEYFEKKE